MATTLISGVQYSGMWTLQQAHDAVAAGTWPEAFNSGYLYTWGDNDIADGKLGINSAGAANNKSSPVQVGSSGDWSQVVLGPRVALAIKDNGTLWGWGFNNQEQIGDNTADISRSSPVQIGALTTWASATIGAYSSYAIRRDGTMWSWGDNSDGALGQNNALGKSSPTQVGALTNWLKITAGGYTCVAIKTDGTLWAWGRNSSGQLGDNTAVTRSSPVQIGALTNWASVTGKWQLPNFLATTTSGAMYSWGDGTQGQLGSNATVSRSSPVQIGALTTWSKIGMNAFALALKTDGTMWSWGSGGQGRLGLNNTTSYSSPVQIGSLNTWAKISAGASTGFAITSSGALWSWGANSSANLGHNDTVYRSSPKQVGSLTSWVAVTGSDIHTTGLRAG